MLALVDCNTFYASCERVFDPGLRSLSFALPLHTNYTPELVHYALWALRKMYRPGYRYMKCGVMLTDLIPEGAGTGDLFARCDTARQSKLMAALRPHQPNHGPADSLLREFRHTAGMDGRFRAKITGIYDGLGQSHPGEG